MKAVERRQLWAGFAQAALSSLAAVKARDPQCDDAELAWVVSEIADAVLAEMDRRQLQFTDDAQDSPA